MLDGACSKSVHKIFPRVTVSACSTENPWLGLTTGIYTSLGGLRMNFEEILPNQACSLWYSAKRDCRRAFHNKPTSPRGYSLKSSRELNIQPASNEPVEGSENEAFSLTKSLYIYTDEFIEDIFLAGVAAQKG